jgi:RDD family
VRLIVERDPDVASLSRRMVAGAVDGVILLIGWGAAIFVASNARRRWARARGRAQDSSVPVRMMGSMNTSASGAWRALNLAMPNWRSPGLRVLGLRRVDARTGGPVGARQAIVRSLADNLERGLWHELIRPATERAELRQRAANDEIARMRETRPDADPEELNRDALAIQARLGASCAPTRRLLLPLAFNWLAMLQSRRRQLPGERLARTVVIRER